MKRLFLFTSDLGLVLSPHSLLSSFSHGNILWTRAPDSAYLSNKLRSTLSRMRDSEASPVGLFFFSLGNVLRPLPLVGSGSGSACVCSCSPNGTRLSQCLLPKPGSLHYVFSCLLPRINPRQAGSGRSCNFCPSQYLNQF